ncbi:MAG: hypothetical protein KDJ14_09160 [Xanthomonadales bacterium]|nr:hypothetical protein [Xanthomonadales bacterium]
MEAQRGRFDVRPGEWQQEHDEQQSSKHREWAIEKQRALRKHNRDA